MKDSILLISGEQAEQILGLVNDSITGVFVGWLGSAMIQSSGALDSIVVTLVSAELLSMSIAVAILLGAELGTTVTTQLVSIFGYMSRMKETFKQSFSIAMLHYFYNLFTLLIFLPIEVFFGTFTSIAIQGSIFFHQVPGIDAIPSIFSFISPWVDFVLHFIPAWIGFLLGIAMLILSLRETEKNMSATFSTDVSRNLIRSTFGKPLRSFFSGLAFTILIPSTSVMVSMLIPLAATGIIGSQHHLLPYILGANIGTVFDVMIAALATGNPAAIGVWLVHLTINIFGACIILPFYKVFNALVMKITDVIAFSKTRIIFSFGLFTGIPVLVLILKIFLLQ
jgi:sodium-dependent phosphate cotransporter